MSTAKHTPGKWEVGDQGDDLTIYPPDSHAGFIAKVSSRKSTEEAGANARLIAAAPDLLAACKAAMGPARMDEWEHAGSVRHNALQELSTAIAKASGEEVPA